ncbi:MAG: chemotaxis protein CheD [Steroidobacteraceae bacterium]
MATVHCERSVDLNLHTLHPGDVVCAERGARLETLLGSCVSIVMTDKRRTIGAMCHIVHVNPNKETVNINGTCGEGAIALLYAALRQRSLNPQMCEAYVYGGGNMFPKLFKQAHVGENNSRWALQRLSSDGVRVLFHDLGGTAYRRLTWTVGDEAPRVQAVAV